MTTKIITDKDRHIKCPHCNGDIHYIAMDMKNQIRKEFVGKTTRCAIRHQVLGSVRAFRNDHPDLINPVFQNSLVKRITGELWNYFEHHKRFNKLKQASK